LNDAKSKIIDAYNITTLYWNPSIILEPGKEIKISIPTGGISGKYRVLIQGRTNDDVLFKEVFLQVNNN
jgi:hypothetical protein